MSCQNIVIKSNPKSFSVIRKSGKTSVVVLFCFNFVLTYMSETLLVACTCTIQRKQGETYCTTPYARSGVNQM